MKKTRFPFSQSGYITKLMNDYLTGDEKLKPFYSLAPSLTSLEEAMKKKSEQPLDRKLLQSILHMQYSGIELTNEEKKSIELISSPKTFSVTTAHQPNLFLGPLYFIIKTVSAITLAKEFKKHKPENNFIPVFWLGSEDADVAELNHIHLFGKKLEWNPNQSGSFGRMKTDSLKNVLEELKTICGNSTYGNELMDLFEDAYLKHDSIKEATRFLLHKLFGNEGLLVIDGDDAQLKNIFSNVMKDELLNATSKKLVSETIAELEKNYEAQAQPRDINLFYLKENLRERIVKEGEKFSIVNSEIVFSESEILAELINNPERFSPNVILRPLFQEMILPNVAFVGGMSEVSYFMEMKLLFANYHISFPMIFQRDRLVWVDSATKNKWEKLGFSEEDLFLSIDELNKKFVLSCKDPFGKKQGENISLEKEKQELEKIFSQVKSKAEAIDKSLAANVEAEKAKQISALQNLEQRMLKAEKKKQETSLQSIQSVKEKLFPESGLQERHESFIPLYLKHGSDFIKILLAELNPLEFSFTVLTEE